MDTGETKLPGFMPGSLVESQISFGLPSADADPDWANTDPDRGTTDTEIPETYRSTSRWPYMGNEHTDHFDAQEARAKAAECRDQAKCSKRQDHQIMLDHMAKVWDRIAKNMEIGS